MSLTDIALSIIGVLFGVVGFMFKTQLNDLKRTDEKHSDAIDHIKENYFKKVDFTEFKNELWARLDKFEEDIKSKLEK